MLIFAHRGDNRHYFENTRAAFDSSLRKGFRAFELDVARTKDGEIVVYHDDTLTKHFKIRKAVGRVTLAEFKSVFPDLLHFDEFCEAYEKENIVVNFEIKDDIETLHKTEKQIRKFKHPVISSFKKKVVDEAIGLKFESGYLFHGSLAFARHKRSLKNTRIHVNKSLVKSSKSFSGYDVFVYTVNTEQEFERLSRIPQIKGVFTDNALFAKYITNK